MHVGEEVLVSTPDRRYGSCGEGLSSMLKRIPVIMLYQLWGGLRKPYTVFLRSHYSSYWNFGSPMGGLITVNSSSGKVALQNALLQSPCLSMHFCGLL